MLNALRSIFTSSTPCPKHDMRQQPTVMEPEEPSVTPSSSRERSRSRSRARSEEKCIKPKVKPKIRQKITKKQVRMRPKVEYESDDDKSLAGSSDMCGDQYDELKDEKEEDDDQEECVPMRRKKRMRRKRAQTVDESDSLPGNSTDVQFEETPEPDGGDSDSDASSAPTEAPSELNCSKKPRSRCKPILKKSAMPRGRQRRRRSRSVRSHVHTLDDHDRGSKCRLCTTCAARYQAILMNGRYA